MKSLFPPCPTGARLVAAMCLAGLVACSDSEPAIPPATTTVVTPAPDPDPAPVTPPAAVPAPTGPATIVFDAKLHDFGSMPETETRSARFTFTNTGGETLRITEVKTSCGCTAAALSKREYAGGESGEIEVSFHPSAPGDQKQYVNVISNGAAAPDRLMITAQVEAFINLEPRMLRLGVMPFKKGHRTEVVVSSPAPDFEISRVSTSNPTVTARLLPEEPGATDRTIEVVVTPNASWGSLHTWLEVTGHGTPSGASAPITHTSKMRVQGQVFGELMGEPDTFRFGIKPGEPFERRVVLKHRTGIPFELKEATPTAQFLKNIELKVNPLSRHEYELLLTATGGDRLLQVQGEVMVVTDIPGEERLAIPIIGVIRTAPGGVR